MLYAPLGVEVGAGKNNVSGVGVCELNKEKLDPLCDEYNAN